MSRENEPSQEFPPAEEFHPTLMHRILALLGLVLLVFVFIALLYFVRRQSA